MVKEFFRAMIPSAKSTGAFLGLMLCDQVVGRLTIGKSLTRGVADSVVGLAGGNRKLIGGG